MFLLKGLIFLLPLSVKRYNFETKLKHKMARDLFHQSVKKALIKEGRTVTNDPYIIETDDVNLEVDL